jgi:hypothetical protein
MCSSSADICTAFEQLMLIGAIGLLLDCGADAHPTILTIVSTPSILFVIPMPGIVKV